MEHILNNGITITDHRGTGKGFTVEDGMRDFMVLHYSTELCRFYISTNGGYVHVEDLDDYLKEVNEMYIALMEANKILTTK